MITSLLALISVILSYGSGASPILTPTDSLLHFSNTDPTVVIPQAGTYMIRARVNVALEAVTYPNIQTITVHLRKTNNNPADISNSLSKIYVGPCTTLTATAGVVQLPEVLYTAAAGDSISIFGSVSGAPSNGEVTVLEASIVAEH